MNWKLKCYLLPKSLVFNEWKAGRHCMSVEWYVGPVSEGVLCLVVIIKSCHIPLHCLWCLVFHLGLSGFKEHGPKSQMVSGS